MVRAVLFAVVLVTACARRVPSPAPKAQCEACLAGGGVWTGGHCERACLMDVSCFKTSCPAEPVKESTSW